jgi:hypothetical protein
MRRTVPDPTCAWTSTARSAVEDPASHGSGESPGESYGESGGDGGGRRTCLERLFVCALEDGEDVEAVQLVRELLVPLRDTRARQIERVFTHCSRRGRHRPRLERGQLGGAVGAMWWRCKYYAREKLAQPHSMLA